MTDRLAVIEMLNDLLALERGGVIAHLLESTPFVSKATEEEDIALRVMVRELGEHANALTREIVALKGGIGPARLDMRTAEMHFQELHHVLPMLIDSGKKLINKYEAAMKHLGGYPSAAVVVSRILSRHREQLAELSAFLSARRAA